MDRMELEILKNKISDLKNEIKKFKSNIFYISYWFMFLLFLSTSISVGCNRKLHQKNNKLLKKQYLKADSIHKATTEFYENFDFGKIIEEPPLC